MKKLLIIPILAVGVFFSSNAMAVHTCGQLLGSCIPHLAPTPIIKPAPVPKPVEPIARPVKPAEPIKIK